MIKITEARPLRDAIFARLSIPPERGDYAAQHDVWPCVRKGAGERWLTNHGVRLTPSKSSALYFLRGNSAEAAIAGIPEDDKLTVYNRVGIHPDASRADLFALVREIDVHFPEEAEALTQWLREFPDLLFGEIKSTNYSSFHFYKLVQQGGIELAVNKAFAGRNYFEQCENYAVALRARHAALIVYTLHGDYGDRRTKCPQCGNKLSDWIDDFYKLCETCGYKSKKIDLWAYLLEFDGETFSRVEPDVYGRRPSQFYAAIEAETKEELLRLASPSPCYYCRTCKVGELIGCENTGKTFD